MTNAHDPVSFPTDPYPVRPGTSAALTARTIDATVHPPLVRAQESVAALIPRLAEPLGSPLLLAMLAGTLVLLWLARRAKFRPAGLLLSAALMMTLTSFRPVGGDDNLRTVDDWPATEVKPAEQFDTRFISPRAPEPPPFVYEAPEIPEPPAPRAAKRRAHRRERSLADQLIASFPGVVIVAKLNAEMLADDQKQLRAYVNELRRRLRSEARRIARDR